jgi:Tol biopolymer transport system component
MPDSRHLVAAACPPENCELLLIDTQEGTTRVLYPIPSALHSPAVSPDGTRIAFSSGVFGWNLVEVVLQDGKARILPSLGIYPAWAPSGNHYVFTSDRSGKWAIEDVTVMNDGENVSRTGAGWNSHPD